MRLLEITNDFPPTIGGIENYVYSLVSRWPPGDVVVLTRAVPGAAEFDRDLGFPVIRRRTPTLLPTSRLLRQALAIVRDCRIDLVHFAGPLPLSLLGPKIRRSLGVPYAVTVHGGEFILPASMRPGRGVLRRALGEAAVLLPVSSFTKRAVERMFGDDPPAQVVSPGVECARFVREAPILRDDRPTILSVSRLVARKGPGTLIRALPPIVRRFPGARLIVVGGGPDLAHLQRLAARLDLVKSVIFAGPRPWSEVPRLYAAADIFALPTRERFGGRETEGFPLVFLEAAAACLPAVAGRAGGVTDAVVPGVTGCLVDGRSPWECSATIQELLSDPDHARQLGDHARRRVVECFDWDRVAERFRSVLASQIQ